MPPCSLRNAVRAVVESGVEARRLTLVARELKGQAQVFTDVGPLTVLGWLPEERRSRGWADVARHLTLSPDHARATAAMLREGRFLLLMRDGDTQSRKARLVLQAHEPQFIQSQRLLLTRQEVTQLLDDDERSLLTSPLLAAPAPGEPFIDLQHLERGVQIGRQGARAMNDLVLRSAVREAAWAVLVERLTAVHFPPRET